MTASVPNRDTIFLAAIEIDSTEERTAYIVQACGGDAELRANVEKLVRAHFRAGSFLEQPALDRGFTSPEALPPNASEGVPLAEGAGGRIGPYKLLQQIGEGGMGAVFMAEQTEPVQRKVALKVIKPGMDSKQVLARFEAERQALALMDHPNIARVFDGGTTDSGRPYFVMELVKGVPITSFCDQRHLTPRQRLELFVPVCQAVQHAHQKGIIHRDLKPSNVLLALYDGQPVPKVIDFGIAKATGPKLTDRTLFTEFGSIVGTLEYMSPEQAELNQLDIDTRSDMYSLGVLLYELLTGSTPLERKRVKEASILEVLRLIREEEPPRPSTRLSSTEELPSIAANRGSEPKKLRGLVRGELDWIVMRCLEKDRNRRYDTANGLARDIERYLHDEPVQACPPSVGYRMRKFVRRNRGPVLAVSLVVLALVGGICGATWGMIRATDEANQKEAALKEAQKSERNAKDQLFGALFHQVHAARSGGQAGQRFDSLNALAEAARIARAREYGEEQFLKLRNEAVACLALPDVRVERTLMENVSDKVPHRYWIVFDPDLRYFVYSDRDGSLSVRRVADGAETARVAGPDARPTWVTLKFSPDGRWLLARYEIPGRPSHQVLLWEFREGNLGRKLALEHVCNFSPDSRFLADGLSDGSIGIYETVSGHQVQRIVEGMGIYSVTSHPGGRQLAVYAKSAPRFVVVLDRESGKEVARYEHPEGFAGDAAWRGDGRLLAVPCNDQRIYVWDHASGGLQSVLEGHTGLGIRVKFSHSGDFLISSSWDGTIRFWDPVTGRQLLSEPGYSHFVAIRRDDRQVALLKNDALVLCELAGGWECRTLHHGLVGNRTPRPADWGPRSVDFSPDGRLLASCSLDGIRLWEPATFTEVGHLPAKETASVLFHPDGNSLFTYGTGGLHRWPIRREKKPTADHPDGITLFQVGPPQALDVPSNWAHANLTQDWRGRWLAAVDYPRGRALLLDLDRPGNKLVLEHPGMAACALSPDGRWAMTWSPPNERATITVWATSDGKRVSWQPPVGHTVTFISPDSRWLVTTPPGDAPLRFWQFGSWQPGPTLPKHHKQVDNLRPSPDGTLLFMGGERNTAPWLLDAGTGRQLAALEAPRDAAGDGRFSPDGTRVAIQTGNHVIHVWDLRAVRRGLAEIGLDWDLPAYRPPDPGGDATPLRVDVKEAAPPPR
jgi:serine/threonine protein kinase/WD40 repeat protein